MALVMPNVSQALYVRYAKPLFIENTLDSAAPIIQGNNCPGNRASWIFAKSMSLAVNPWPSNIDQTYRGLLSIVWTYKSDNNIGTSCIQPIGIDYAALKQSENMWAAADNLSKQPKLEYVANRQPTGFYYSADLKQWKSIYNTIDKKTYYFIGCENDTSDPQNRFIRCCFELDPNATTCSS